MPLATDVDIIYAYRNTHKALLRAVQYSKPARFVARDRVRLAFRQSRREDFDAPRLARTLEFLDNAAKWQGLEHRIVKNLMHVWWEKGNKGRSYAPKWTFPARSSAHRDFDRCIEMLNTTMGLCIK